jgi:hypothetical protein
VLKCLCQGFLPLALLAVCAPYPTLLPTPPCGTILFASDKPNDSCVQPACGVHLNSISAGIFQIPSWLACCDWSPSPGIMVLLMEVCVWFSPTLPGRNLSFGVIVRVGHILRICYKVVCLLCLLPIMYLLLLLKLLHFVIAYVLLCRCTSGVMAQRGSVHVQEKNSQNLSSNQPICIVFNCIYPEYIKELCVFTS